jgi:Uma2 family endonuclease
LAVFPPDVVVEVDLTHSSVGKLPFYARLGVPEVWRFDGKQVWMHRLAGSSYQDVQSSDAFPGFTAATLATLLERMRTDGQHTVLAAFRKSLRSE